MDYRPHLHEFYADRNIACDNFQCPHRQECFGTDGEHKFHRGAEAYVGSRYGHEGDPCKVVILAQDKGADPSRDIWKRSKEVEELPIEKIRLHPHLRGTLRTIQALFERSKDDYEVWKHFAMINAAKCSYHCSNNSAPQRLYRNCAPFALEELGILSPDIVVIQGVKALIPLRSFGKLEAELDRLLIKLSSFKREASERFLVRSSLEDTGEIDAQIKKHLWLTETRSRKLICLYTPHPASRRGEWQSFVGEWKYSANDKHDRHLDFLAAISRKIAGVL